MLRWSGTLNMAAGCLGWHTYTAPHPGSCSFLFPYNYKYNCSYAGRAFSALFVQCQRVTDDHSGLHSHVHGSKSNAILLGSWKATKTDTAEDRTNLQGRQTTGDLSTQKKKKRPERRRATYVHVVGGASSGAATAGGNAIAGDFVPRGVFLSSSGACGPLPVRTYTCVRVVPGW